MLKDGVRVSDVARYHNCHPSPIQRSEIVTRLLGQLKIDTDLCLVINVFHSVSSSRGGLYLNF